MKWKNATDWLFCTDMEMTNKPKSERERLYILTRQMCPFDKELDSPCPKWIINILLCTTLSYRQRLKLVMKHHQLLTGKSYGQITKDETLKIKEDYGK